MGAMELFLFVFESSVSAFRLKNQMLLSLFFFSDLSWFSLPQRLFFFVLTLCQAMSLCCFDFSFASCHQNATGWLALCCLSKQRIASPHLTAKEQRQSNGTKQHRNPEVCSGRPQFQWIPMNSILHSALNLGCFSVPLSVRYAHTTSHCPVQISQPERLISHCTMLHATYTTAMSRRDLAHNLITTLQNKQKEETRKK